MGFRSHYEELTGFGRIEHVFYPVFPPDKHAARVLAWLREHPARPAA